MALHISGTFLGTTRDVRRGKNGDFEVVTAHILDGVHTSRVEFTKDFTDALPAEGEFVVLDVYVFGYKSNAGNVGVDMKAHRRNGEVEAALVSMLAAS